MKHVGQYNTTVRQLLRRKYWIDSKCPRCKCRNEDSNHIVIYLDATSMSKLADNIYNMEEDLKRIRTHPSIAKKKLYTLYDRGSSSFESNIPTQRSIDDSEIYHIITQAAKEQDQIPFTYIFEGHIVKKWSAAQDIAYQNNNNRNRLVKIWAQKEVRLLYKITQDMWRNRNENSMKIQLHPHH